MQEQHTLTPDEFRREWDRLVRSTGRSAVQAAAPGILLENGLNPERWRLKRAWLRVPRRFVGFRIGHRRIRVL
jgi:hypothetical protein